MKETDKKKVRQKRIEHNARKRSIVQKRATRASRVRGGGGGK